MPLTSVFYDGPVTETDRAENRAGAPDYGVYGPDDFKVATHPSIPYALTVKAGKAHGHGVTDTAETDQLVQCSTLSGTDSVRWDLIVVRRNWQPLLGGPSTLAAVQGGTTTAIPAGRLDTPGVEDDQPIAFVQWRGNQNTPAQIIDMRCWAANGGLEAVAGQALQYLGKPGAAVRIGDTLWRYSLQGNGVWGWLAQAIEHHAPAGPSVYGNGFVPYEVQGWGAVTAQLVEGVVYINGAALGNLDWTAGTAVCNFPPPYRPRRNVQGVNCQISAGGDVVMTSGGKAKQAVSVSASFPIDLGEV